ncbi:MAG: oxidoreductase [Polyangiaceae bacterium]|nr:oxidoreductase [Polyangiaceae bacterium]
MEGRAVLGRLSWQLGEVIEVRAETANARSITLTVPSWPGHRPGQHIDIRLTAEDGYQVERSYSIASPPEDEHITVTVERTADGEVSPYLVDELELGDRIELRGPIGGYFVWSVPLGGPLLLVAGGSGIAPLMAMLRHRRAAQSTVPTRLLYSSRSLDDVIYREELASIANGGTGVETTYTLTRMQPAGWTGYRRRVDTEMLREVAWPVDLRPQAFICGPTDFVETAAAGLVALGHAAARIKTERFGPSGGE